MRWRGWYRGGTTLAGLFPVTLIIEQRFYPQTLFGLHLPRAKIRRQSVRSAARSGLAYLGDAVDGDLFDRLTAHHRFVFEFPVEVVWKLNQQISAQSSLLTTILAGLSEGG